MKKSFLKPTILLLAAVILMLCSASCDKDPKCCDTCNGCTTVEINKKECIMMCIVPDVVTANSVNKVRLENHTKTEMIYGSPFSIEYYNGNYWETLQFDFGFTDIGYFLLASETKEWDTNFYLLAEKYNNSKKGKYRYIKDFYLKNIDDYDLIVEFEIK
jgi:hypothetical protein